MQEQAKQKDHDTYLNIEQGPMEINKQNGLLRAPVCCGKKAQFLLFHFFELLVDPLSSSQMHDKEINRRNILHDMVSTRIDRGGTF